MTSVEQIARAFHEHYEHIAPELGYKTRPESAVRWEDLPVTNKAVMLSVVEVLLINGIIQPGPQLGRPNG